MIEALDLDIGIESKVSSAVFGIVGLFFILPDPVFAHLPVVSLISGLFSNTVGYVMVKSIGVSIPYFALGLFLLSVAAVSLFDEGKGIVLNFLMSGALAVYGILAALYLLIQPTPLHNLQIIGIATQIVIFGILAGFLYKKAIKGGSYEIQYDRSLFFVGFTFLFTSLASMSLIEVLSQSSIGLKTPVYLIGVLFGLSLVFSTIKVIEKTVLGFWSAMVSSIVLMSFSLGIYDSLLGGVVFLLVINLLWEKRDVFADIERPLEYVRKNLDY